MCVIEDEHDDGIHAYKLDEMLDALPSAPSDAADSTDAGTLPEEDAPATRRGLRRFKVAMCSGESLHYISIRGVTPHLMEFASRLERRGHEVHSFVGTGA